MCIVVEALAVPVLTLRHISDATMPMDPGIMTGFRPYLSNTAPNDKDQLGRSGPPHIVAVLLTGA